MYEVVKLNDADAARLRKLNDTQRGFQNFLQQMMTAGERRSAALQQEGRELFAEFAKTYGLDLARVSYTPSQDGMTLVPVAVRLANE